MRMTVDNLEVGRFSPEKGPGSLISGQKKNGYMINKWQFCAAKLAKSANYASSAFFREIHENYASNYELCQNGTPAKNYARPIY